MKERELKDLCTGCLRVPPGGYIIIKGQSRYLTDLCRKCFIKNSEGREIKQSDSRPQHHYGPKP